MRKTVGRLVLATFLMVALAVVFGMLSPGSVTRAQAVCVPPDPSLVSWWRAENNALDSKDGNHGALVGNVAYGAGKIGQAFRFFETASSGVEIPDAPNLTSPRYTIEAWVNPASSISSLGLRVLYGQADKGSRLLSIINTSPLVERLPPERR